MEELKKMMENKIIVYETELTALRSQQWAAYKLSFNHEGRILDIKIKSMIEKKMYLEELIYHINNKLKSVNRKDDS